MVTFGSGYTVQIDCVGGYFILREKRAGDISDLASLFKGLEFERVDGYFTFKALVNAPRYSIKGGKFLGAPCKVTIEGEPWNVMRANGLGFDFVQNKVVLLSSVVRIVEIAQAANYFLSQGLIVPGSVADDGLRVTDYAAHYLFNSNKFRYSEVSFG